MVTLYMTKNKVKGVNGLGYYYVTNKKDIGFLGGLNSKYASSNPKDFKKIYKQLKGKTPIIKFISSKGKK